MAVSINLLALCPGQEERTIHVSDLSHDPIAWEVIDNG